MSAASATSTFRTVMPLMSMPKIARGDPLGLVRGGRELHAAGLAAPADEDLRLDDDRACAGTGSARRPRVPPARYGRPPSRVRAGPGRRAGIGVGFLDLHERRAPPASGLFGSVMVPDRARRFLGSRSKKAAGLRSRQSHQGSHFGVTTRAGPSRSLTEVRQGRSGHACPNGSPTDDRHRVRGQPKPGADPACPRALVRDGLSNPRVAHPSAVLDVVTQLRDAEIQVALAIAEQQMPSELGTALLSRIRDVTPDGPSRGAHGLGSGSRDGGDHAGLPAGRHRPRGGLARDPERRAIPCDHRRPPRRLGNRAGAECRILQARSRSRMTPKRSCCVTRLRAGRSRSTSTTRDLTRAESSPGRFRAAESCRPSSCPTAAC